MTAARQVGAVTDDDLGRCVGATDELMRRCDGVANALLCRSDDRDVTAAHSVSRDARVEGQVG